MLIWGAVLAAAGLPVIGAGVASAKATKLGVVAVSSKVGRTQTAFVIATAPKGARCSLSVTPSAGGLVSQSAKLHPGSSGQIEFLWSFPASAKAGSWIAHTRCSDVPRALVSRIKLTGRSHGADRPFTIRTVAVSKKGPTMHEPPSTGGKGGASYPPFGTPIILPNQWFGGITVYSNGSSGNPNGKWQCVDLFERLINAKGWFHGIAGGGSPDTPASALFDRVPSSAFDKHPNGSGYIPVTGDAIVFGGGTYGHIAIVESVGNGLVNLVEQNASANGRTSIRISGSTMGKDGYLSVEGTLHAKLNTQPNAAPTPVTPAVPVTPVTPAPTGPVYGVMNTSETPPDGVYFRSSPHTADTSATSGLGVYANEKVSLSCYAYGDVVGAYNDALWYQVVNITRPTNGGAPNGGWLSAHYINDGQPANVVDAGVQACVGYSSTPPPGIVAPPPAPSPTPPAPTPTPPAPPTPVYAETTGGVAHTWTNYSNAGGNQGPSIASNQTVGISCKVGGFAVADGNTWWYRISDGPWSNQYFVSADAFYNNGQTSGSLHGTPFVDPAVPDC